tara:strand:- start:3558 stop:3698 length:141 start_codon:yes stop_codon:yes gene_type:complete
MKYIKWFKVLYKEYGLIAAILYTPYNAKHYDPDNIDRRNFGTIKNE